MNIETVLPNINYNKFKQIENDGDYAVYQRSFSGRITRHRYNTIRLLCRKLTFSQRCHHDFDCCGCITSQVMSFYYRHNQIVVTLTIHRNY